MRVLPDERFRETFETFGHNYKKGSRHLRVGIGVYMNRLTKLGLREKASHGGARNLLHRIKDEDILKKYRSYAVNHESIFLKSKCFWTPNGWICKELGYKGTHVMEVLKDNELEISTDYWYAIYKAVKKKELRILHILYKGSSTKAVIGSGYGITYILEGWKSIGLVPKGQEMSPSQKLCLSRVNTSGQ